MDINTLHYSNPNQSDDSKSTVSSLSAVSVYGEEFVELRHLIDPEKYPTPPPRNCSTPIYNDSGCDVQCEDRLANLSFQLQSTLKLNEKYKNDLFNLEKDIELRYHDKIERLLKNNKQLKVELIAANEKIDSLFKKFTSVPASTIDKSFIQLEKKCHELNLKNYNLETKLVEVVTERNNLEILSKQLKVEAEDCKVDNETKNVCIKELKEKISQQFIEIQALIKSRNMNVQCLKETVFELEHLKKVQAYNKELLDTVQMDKKILTENLTKVRTEFLDYKEKLDKANLDVKVWQNKFENLQLECLKTKEKLYLEIKNYSLENKQKTVENKCACTDQALLNYYELNISDLKEEILSIKKLISENDNTIKQLTKQNSDLTSRYLILQKTTQQKDLSIEEFNCTKNQLNMEITLLKQKDYDKTREVLELKNDICKLEAEILIKREENAVIENNVKIVREQFLVLKKQYDKLKEDILEKSKQILNLQNEKQELFMNNNWKICELEKAKEKDVFIENLKKDIVVKNQELSRNVNDLKAVENKYQEVCYLNSVLTEDKNNITKSHNEEKERYENVLLQYRKTVQNLEDQLSHLQKDCEENNLAILNKEENIKILIDEINHRDLKLVQLQKSLTFNEQMPQQFQNEMNKLQEQIKMLTEKTQNCSCDVHNFTTVQAEERTEVDELKILLQVKDLQLTEKQRKYERNYRTLLRKVKEHMKGRSSAEKQNKYLQDLYDGICDENNSLKLSLNLKENETVNDKKCISRYMALNDSLKEKILQLECENGKREMCMQCFDYKVVCEKLHNLQNESLQMQNLILEKENANMLLQNEIQEIKMQLSDMQNEKNNLIREIEEILLNSNKLLEEKSILETELNQMKVSIAELKALLKEEAQTISQKNDRILTLETQVGDTNFKMQCMENDLENLNATLRTKMEELEFLDKERSARITEWDKKNEASELLINNLKEHIQELQAEISLIVSEKHFLQRLCSDLKLALKSHVNYNKVLKEQLYHLPKEKPNFNSLPNNILPNIVSDQYNEDYINELLHRQKGDLEKQPFIDLQQSLDDLRREITTLQHQITKKNNSNG